MSKKVLFAGNMNNYFLSNVRHLRNVGVDAHLMVLGNDPELFMPWADAFDFSWREYTRRVSWGEPTDLMGIDLREVERDLAPYDFVFACGAVPAIMWRLGRRLDAFAPYGSDLMEMTVPQLRQPGKGGWKSVAMLAYAQRKGIAETRASLGAPAVPLDNMLKKIGFRGKRLPFALAPLFADELNPEIVERFADRSVFLHEFQRVRADSDVMLFHPSRHIWGKAFVPFSSKDNDKLIRAFARMVHGYPDVRFSLVMFEYGRDVAASRALVEALGVAHRVLWCPTLDRKEIFMGLALSDIQCAEFADSWLFGAAIIEALAMKKPLLSNRLDSDYQGTYPELYPMMNAATEDEIYAQLVAYVQNPAHFRAMGEKAHGWFRRHVIEEPIGQMIDLVNNGP